MAKKRKGKKRKVWLTVLVILALLGAVAGYGAYRVLRNRDIKYLHRANILIRKGKSRAAKRLLEQSLEINPDNLTSQERLYQVLVQLNEFDRAFKELDKAEALAGRLQEAGKLGDGKRTDWDLVRAKVYLAKADHRLKSASKKDIRAKCDAIISEDIDEALRLIEKHLSSHDNSVEGYISRGIVLTEKITILNRQRRELAEEIRAARNLQQEEVVEEKGREAAQIFARIQGTVRDTDKAYRDCLSIDPGATRARLNLARLYVDSPIGMPNLWGALAVLKPILDETPGSEASPEKRSVYENALFVAGSARRLLGDDGGALAHFRRIEEAVDKLVEQGAIFQEAEILLNAKKTAEATNAVEKLESAIQNEKDVRLLYLRGRLLKEQGRWEDAAATLQNAFTARVTLWRPRARHELAEALLKAGQRERALQAYRDTVSDVDAILPPGSYQQVRLLPRLLEPLGLRYASCVTLARALMNENTEDAARYASEALNIAPASTEAYELARKAYEKLGQPKGVRRILYLRIQALARKGVYSEAEKGYREVLAGFATDAAENARVRRAFAAMYQQVGRNDDAERLYVEMLLARELKPGEDLNALHPEILKADLSDAAVVGDLAMLLHGTGRSDKAIELLQKGLAANASAPGLTTRLVSIYRGEKKYDAALDLLRKRITARPDNALLRVAAAGFTWLKGDRAGARRYFDEVLKLDPKLPTAYQRVVLDLIEGKYDEALKLAEQGMSELPKRAEAYYYLALASHAKGDFAKAEELFSKLYKASRAFRRPAAMMLQYVLAGQGKIKLAPPPAAPAEVEAAQPPLLDEAEHPQETPTEPDRAEAEAQALERNLLLALSAAPPDIRQKAAVVASLVHAAEYLRLPAEALAQARIVEKLMSQQPQPACWCALLSDGLGKHQEAIETYRRVIEDHPRFGLAALLLARSHIAKDDNAAAVATLEAAVKRNIGAAEKASAYYQLGQMYQVTDDLDAAIRNYKAAAERPSAAEQKSTVLNNLAWLLATRKGDLDAALVHAKQAVQLNPRNPNIVDTLGWTYYLRGEYADAVKHLQRAVSATATLKHPSIRAHLGLACWKAGDDDKAQSELREALWLSQSFPEAADAKKALDAIGSKK